MSDPRSCAACPAVHSDLRFLNCSRCNDNYHHTCMNITVEQFNTLSDSFKESWICMSCRNKEPKGDNSNTPIRSAFTPTSYDNVTLRAKKRSTPTCPCLTISDVRGIIREELQQLIRSELSPKINEVKEAVGSIEASISSFHEELNVLKSTINSQSEAIEKLRKENLEIKSTTQSLTARLQQLEQRSRSSNVEIQCVPEFRSENPINIIQQLGKVIKCPVNDVDIHYCSRIAKANPENTRPRSILIKLSSPRLRDRFLASVVRFNKENQKEKLNSSHLGISGATKTPVYVTEHLTQDNKILHAAARRKSKELQYKFVWVRDVLESGDDPVVCMGHRTLVLANHQSTADVPLLMTAWNPKPGILPNIMWIMDRLFMYTNFGIVSMVHGDFFIQAGRTKREQSLTELRQHLYQWYLPLERQMMVLFPEGGFLHKRKEISQRFAEKNNLPRLEYVTIPRAGAMKVILEELGTTPNKDEVPSTSQCDKDKNFNQNNLKKAIVRGRTKHGIGDHVEWIIDLTIAYENRQPLHLSDIVCGIRDPCTTHIHYRVFHGSEVPKDPEGMTQWLYDRFIEKDKLLSEYYTTGKFPPRGPLPNIVRPVRQDNIRYLILHLFFIASSFLQIKLCLWVLGY